jgi:hypothetical protein
MEEIFDDCRDLVQSAVDGHNVTVMTYGQTGWIWAWDAEARPCAVFPDMLRILK